MPVADSKLFGFRSGVVLGAVGAQVLDGPVGKDLVVDVGRESVLEPMQTQEYCHHVHSL